MLITDAAQDYCVTRDLPGDERSYCLRRQAVLTLDVLDDFNEALRIDDFSSSCPRKRYLENTARRYCDPSVLIRSRCIVSGVVVRCFPLPSACLHSFFLHTSHMQGVPLWLRCLVQHRWMRALHRPNHVFSGSVFPGVSAEDCWGLRNS